MYPLVHPHPEPQLIPTPLHTIDGDSSTANLQIIALYLADAYRKLRTCLDQQLDTPCGLTLGTVAAYTCCVYVYLYIECRGLYVETMLFPSLMIHPC